VALRGVRETPIVFLFLSPSNVRHATQRAAVIETGPEYIGYSDYVFMKYGEGDPSYRLEEIYLKSQNTNVLGIIVLNNVLYQFIHAKAVICKRRTNYNIYTDENNVYVIVM